MYKYVVNVEFTTELLGSAPLNDQLYTEHVLKKYPGETIPEDESGDTVDADTQLASRTSGFHRLPSSQPVMLDYQWKGYFKEACQFLRRVKETKSSGIKAFLQQIEALLFVIPRKIPIELPNDPAIRASIIKPMTNLGDEWCLPIVERPVLVKTPMGKRSALVRSESVPVGSKMYFEILLLGGDIKEGHLREWLDYGLYKGHGQWRSSGAGCFIYGMDDVSDSISPEDGPLAMTLHSRQ